MIIIININIIIYKFLNNKYILYFMKYYDPKNNQVRVKRETPLYGNEYYYK